MPWSLMRRTLGMNGKADVGSFKARLLPAIAHLTLHLTNIGRGLRWAGSGKVIHHLKKLLLDFSMRG